MKAIRTHGAVVAGWLRRGVVAAAVASAACGLDDVRVPGNFGGPAELGVSLKLTVSPDLIVADGFSTALVQAEARGPDGRPFAGLALAFALADEAGRYADLGTLSAASAVTDGAGNAFLVYTAPSRSDATANQTLVIVARPVGSDANAAFYRQVRLELRSAEPRLFPQRPEGNANPTCTWAVEAPYGFFVGRDILFQSTARDPDGTVVRYFWDFGDGTREDRPDVNHVYRAAGKYTITHITTDDDGGQNACNGNVTIQTKPTP